MHSLSTGLKTQSAAIDHWNRPVDALVKTKVAIRALVGRGLESLHAGEDAEVFPKPRTDEAAVVAAAVRFAAIGASTGSATRIELLGGSFVDNVALHWTAIDDGSFWHDL